MKIINDEIIKIYLNKDYLKYKNYDISKIEDSFKQIFETLKYCYNIEINGFYDIDVYIDKNYGIIIEMKKEDIDFDFRGRKEYRRSEVLHQGPEGSLHSFSRKYGKNTEIRSAFRFPCQNVHKVCLQTGRSGCQSPVPAG